MIRALISGFITATALLCALNVAHAQSGVAHDLNLESGALPDVLRRLADQVNLQMVFYVEDAQTLTVGPLRGRYTAEQALEVLLKGSGLEYQYVDAMTISVRRKVRTSAAGAAQPTTLKLAQADTASPAQVAQAEAPAENPPPQPPQNGHTEEILVTGTHIRGIGPKGSPTLVFDRQAIDASGIQSTERFLRSIPQNFGGLDGQGGVPLIAGESDNNVGGASINLRGLGPNATLTLLNGRRLAPAGFNGGFTDITLIPLSLVERIEILTDGASAIYGADAVAGVVNFVLRDAFVGAETQANFGAVTEGNLTEKRATQLLGHAWGSGNLIGSVEYYAREDLDATEKDFAAGAPELSTLLPEQEHWIATLLGRQRIGERVQAHLNAFYGARDSDSVDNFGFENAPIVRNANDSWQLMISPGVEVDMPGDWRLNTGVTYGETYARSQAVALNDHPEANGLNKYISSTESANVVADGPVTRFSGGEVRLALGAEARREDLRNKDATGATVLSMDRDVSAAFAELFVPLFGASNSRRGAQRLDLSLAGRYDDYSDFGSSFNPKLGISFSTFESLALRASYGTSFNPPNLGNLARKNSILVLFSLPNAADPTGFSPTGFILGNDIELEPEESENISFGFDFQRAFSFGDVSASMNYFRIEYEDLFGEMPFPGGSFLNLVDRRDELPSFAVIESPSQQDVDNAVRIVNELGEGIIVDATGLNLVNPDGSVNAAGLQFLLDIRSTNVARAINRGVDFSFELTRPTRWGDLSSGLGGVYLFDYLRQGSETSPEFELVDTIYYPSDLKMRGNVGLSRGGWSATAFVNYTDDYLDQRDEINRHTVDAWVTFDLNLRYSFGAGNRALSGVDVSLGATNLFDRDPPEVRDDRLFNSFFSTASYDRANADPMGRLVYLELRKKWGRR